MGTLTSKGETEFFPNSKLTTQFFFSLFKFKILQEWYQLDKTFSSCQIVGPPATAGHQVEEKQTFWDRQKFLVDGVAGVPKFGQMRKFYPGDTIFEGF